MVIDFDFGAIIGNHPMTDGLRMVGVVFLLLFHIQLENIRAHCLSWHLA
jgi:hypothetical protein